MRSLQGALAFHLGLPEILSLASIRVQGPIGLKLIFALFLTFLPQSPRPEQRGAFEKLREVRAPPRLSHGRADDALLTRNAHHLAPLHELSTRPAV